MAERYADLVASHRETLETHQALVESLSADTDYRTLNRQYGRLITEQRMLSQNYRSVTERVYATVTGNPEPTRIVPESESYTSPYIYRRMENQPARTMSAALNGRL